MKVKKILSISAVALTIAGGMSIGVFAIDNALSGEKKAVMQGLIKSYYADQKPINGLDVTKNTKISDVLNINSDYYKKIQGKLNSYTEGSVLVSSVNDGASINQVLNSSLVYAGLNKDSFNTYKAMVTDVYNQLMDIDETTDPAMRIAKEQQAAQMINASYGNVKFGKNSEGNTTMSLEKDNKIILQINTADAKKLMDILNSYNTYDEFKNFLTDLGIDS